MAQTSSSPANKRTAILGVTLAVLVLVLVGELSWKNKSAEKSESPTPSSPTTGTKPATSGASYNEETSETVTQKTTVAPSAADANATYKDGTYKATGSYQSPQGTDTIGVSVTLKSNVITAVTVTPNSNEISGKWQTNFAKNVSAVVVGKKISDVQLTNVSGSSLTPIGFNDALAQIKTQAKG